MSDSARHHIRVSELRLRVPRRESDGYFEFPKHMLHWSQELRDPATGEVFDRAYVLAELEKQGWDPHELTKGEGTFRQRVQRLPLPEGGQFTPGGPLRRDA